MDNDEEKPYAVILKDDNSLLVVVTKWLIDRTACLLPKFSQQAYRKALQLKPNASDIWDMVGVKKIIGHYDTLIEADGEVSELANKSFSGSSDEGEDKSVDRDSKESDDDNGAVILDRRTRHLRAKKQLPSDETTDFSSTDLTPQKLPVLKCSKDVSKPPQLTIKNKKIQFKKRALSNVNELETIKRRRVVVSNHDRLKHTKANKENNIDFQKDTLCDNENEGLSDDESVAAIQRSSMLNKRTLIEDHEVESIDAAQGSGMTNHSRSIAAKNIVTLAQDKNEDHGDPITARELAKTNFKLMEIDEKLSWIIKQMKKLSTGTCSTVRSFAEIEEYFPLKEKNNVEDLEFKLSSDDRFKGIFLDWCKSHGGNNVDETTTNILVKLFDDKLASLYSYNGQKKNNEWKFPLKHLLLIDQLYLAVLDCVAGSQRSDIKKRISKWFVQAPKRAQGQNVNISAGESNNTEQEEATHLEINNVPILREMILPATLTQEFLTLASTNTSRNKETCGILAGRLENSKLIVTHLLIPHQTGTTNSCTTSNEEDLFAYQNEHNLITLGWIHTHPTQTAFLSSVDLHTHCAYQLMTKEAIAIVCAPKFDATGFFILTPEYGLNFIANCKKSGFHYHLSSPPLYEKASHYALDETSPISVYDFREK